MGTKMMKMLFVMFRLMMAPTPQAKENHDQTCLLDRQKKHSSPIQQIHKLIETPTMISTRILVDYCIITKLVVSEVPLEMISQLQRMKIGETTCLRGVFSTMGHSVNVFFVVLGGHSRRKGSKT